MVKDNASTLEEQSGIPLSSPVIMANTKRLQIKLRKHYDSTSNSQPSLIYSDER